MRGLKILCILFGVLLSTIIGCNGSSDSCIRLYKEGGAPAVFQSPECSFEYVRLRIHNQSTVCQFASIKGRREYQEDRVLCDLDMKIDLFDVGLDTEKVFNYKIDFDAGSCDQEYLKIGLAAVFDGHGGKEASELAVQLFPYYLQLHISFLSQKEMKFFEDRHTMAYPLETEVNPFETYLGRCLDKTKTKELIQEAILLTIHDIDSTFSQVALKRHLLAGTTATIALLMDNELVVANVGDSKALLCSEKLHNNEGTSLSILDVVELTKDHHPDRDDEKARIEDSGGFVTLSGVPRVNGILAVSRSIGDVYLKRYGVISEPEFVDWRLLNAREVILVVASDGIFESLSTQEVCTHLHNTHSQAEDQKRWTSKSEPSSLAECLVNTALNKGSTDNLSVVVVPLRSYEWFLENVQRESI
ncbi:putative protein phosphatase 2C 51 [Bienertia sinuspersici]